MTKQIAIIASIFAAQAIAAPMIDHNGDFHGTTPQRVEWAGGVVSGPSEAWLVASGWGRLATTQEIADHDAAVALAASNAAASSSLPVQSATGFAVLDAAGHWIELEPTGDGLPVIGMQVSNSPLTPAQRAEMKAARKSAMAALKANAASAKNANGKIAALMEAVFGIKE